MCVHTCLCVCVRVHGCECVCMCVGRHSDILDVRSSAQPSPGAVRSRGMAGGDSQAPLTSPSPCDALGMCSSPCAPLVFQTPRKTSELFKSPCDGLIPRFS